MLDVKLLNKLKILTQPDDSTCGPTSLHAVYQYYQDMIPLEEVIGQVSFLAEGGTLAVLLACHALKRGYKARLFSYNLHVFDPTWFKSSNAKIVSNLKEQREYKKDAKLQMATDAYIEFLELGGELRCDDLTPKLLDEYFSKGMPILTGLSATYLYNCARERTNSREKPGLVAPFQGVAGQQNGQGAAFGQKRNLADNLFQRDHVLIILVNRMQAGGTAGRVVGLGKDLKFVQQLYVKHSNGNWLSKFFLALYGEMKAS